MRGCWKRWVAPGLGLLGVVACDGTRTRADRAEAADTLAAAEELPAELATRLPAGVTFEEARSGERLFAVCSVCHGADARGTQLGPSLRDSVWIHGTGELEEIAEVIRVGVPEPIEHPVPMPALGGAALSEEEVRALAAYVLLLRHLGE